MSGGSQSSTMNYLSTPSRADLFLSRVPFTYHHVGVDRVELRLTLNSTFVTVDHLALFGDVFSRIF